MDPRVRETASKVRTFEYVGISIGEVLSMADRSFQQELQGFALELRRLAYTMPAGHEDRLIRLSDQMAARSRQTVEAQKRRA